jgi:hypothetical protein
VFPSFAPGPSVQRGAGWADGASRLSKYTPQSILRLPIMTDRRVLAASQILNLIYLYATSAKPELAPLVGFALVRLTLEHGLSPMSCMGFITFAMCLCGYAL